MAETACSLKTCQVMWVQTLSVILCTWQAAAEALLDLVEALDAPALAQLLADAPALLELLTAPPADALPEVRVSFLCHGR